MKKVYAYLSEHKMDFELIAVDDSSDGTWETLQSFQNTHKNVIVLKGGEPSGYGKALRKGFSFSTGEILIPFNGDLSDSLKDIITYIKLIEDGYDMVFGSRFMVGAEVTDSVVTKEFLSRFSNMFLQFLFQTKCTDITNSFKAYKRKVWDEIKPISKGYSIGMEIALKGILREYKYTTIPVTWTGRKHGRSKMSIVKSILIYFWIALKIRSESLRFWRDNYTN